MLYNNYIYDQGKRETYKIIFLKYTSTLYLLIVLYRYLHVKLSEYSLLEYV